MEEPKGLIQVIDAGCYELYKNGVSVEEISEEVCIPVIRVKEAIHREKNKGNIEEDTNMNNLIKQVEQWSIDKGIDKGNSDRQALKFYEEAGEIGAALSRNRMDDLKDGIGDTIVTLIILAQQHGMTIEECLQYAYDEISQRKGRTINGTFIKESDLNGEL